MKDPKVRFLRTALAVSLGVVPLTNCICNPEDLDVVAPAIYVDVCAEPVREIDGEFLGGFEECAADFGTTDISVRETLQIYLSNPTGVALGGRANTDAPMDIFLSESSDPAFRIEAAPDRIEPGFTRVPLVVSYRPTLEATQTATLVIRSDAANVPQGQDVIIPITGTGVDNGIPDIEITSSSPGPQGGSCDFGRIAAGSVKECLLTITNNGTRALVFDEMIFLEDIDGDVWPKAPDDSELAPFGFFGRAPQADDVVPAPPESNSITVAVRFTPDVLGAYSGKLAVRTNDPDEPEIIIDLSGIGVDPPACNIRIDSVNGFPVSGGAPVIEPLDDVILTAADSTPSTASGDIVAVQWEVIDKPAGSTAVLTNPTGTNTGFTFADVLGVDLAGRYRLRASVVDDLGTQSVNECELEFEAIPTDSLLVQLTWDTSCGDMDLHLIKQDDQSRFCTGTSVSAPNVAQNSCSGLSTPGDCYFGNCNPGDGVPDWDGDGQSESEGDPSLDIDDTNGFGPENTNIDTAVPGRYLVGVDYWGPTGCGSSPVVGNTLRVYLYGQLSAEFFRELVDEDWWEVGIINWPQACIDPLNTAADECAE